MNKELFGGFFGASLSAVGTASQTNQSLQDISLVLTIIGTLITIIMAITNWWKNAKKDGKIDEDEINEGLDIIKHGAEELKDKIDDKEDKK